MLTDKDQDRLNEYQFREWRKIAHPTFLMVRRIILTLAIIITAILLYSMHATRWEFLPCMAIVFGWGVITLFLNWKSNQHFSEFSKV